MSLEKITFSFGKNWKNYSRTVRESNIRGAEADIQDWLGADFVRGKTVIDVGSGSGIHSMCFYNLGASSIFSFDYDRSSVESTRSFWLSSGAPKNWLVREGSILDAAFIQTISKSDIVYSWGVLHHTGAMWRALENAAELVKPGGTFFISIYAKGPRYEQDLALKRKFNEGNFFQKKILLYSFILKRHIWRRLKNRENPFRWNYQKARGMNVYYDVVDWLGGLPYEVAHESEITAFLVTKGFKIVRKELKPEGACHRLLYVRTQ
ncbi:MAG: class I SAM-dependent methyltransferase [Cyclobacteriaceae bacterium]|nr:class I SAM-dependent methyltransferase [Cyclobacteriaceae bacterium]